MSEILMWAAANVSVWDGWAEMALAAFVICMGLLAWDASR